MPGSHTDATGGLQSGSSMSDMVAGLASDKWLDRHAAEVGLLSLGRSAVPTLVDCLDSTSAQVRRGAAKVLKGVAGIADPSVAVALARALVDNDGGVRWLAADALIAMGPKSIGPVLRLLVQRGDSPWAQEGAHHVLRQLAVPQTNAVVHALEDHFPELTVPVAANAALNALA